MTRFVLSQSRTRSTLLPECLEDFVDDENPVRMVGAFVEHLDPSDLGSAGVTLATTGRPTYHPAALLKFYFYGYLNRIQSSRRLEGEAQRCRGSPKTDPLIGSLHHKSPRWEAPVACHPAQSRTVGLSLD